MSDYTRVGLDKLLVAKATAEAKLQGIKRHEWIEDAIRKGLDGGDRLRGECRPEEEAASASQPSTPSQILATPIEEFCKERSKQQPHRWCEVIAGGVEYERCDFCYQRKPVTETMITNMFEGIVKRL